MYTKTIIKRPGVGARVKRGGIRRGGVKMKKPITERYTTPVMKKPITRPSPDTKVTKKIAVPGGVMVRQPASRMQVSITRGQKVV